MATTLIVRGYSELIRDSRLAGLETGREVRAAFNAVGELVRRDAAPRFIEHQLEKGATPARIRAATKTAAGFKVRVRSRGVEVEQSLRKVTGLRPAYGSLQMRRALIPALRHQEPEIVAEFDKAMGRVAAIFGP